MKISHYIKLNEGLRLAGFLSALLFSVIFGLTFLPISFHQETTEATGSSDPSITMTFTNSTASVDLAVNSTNGTFAESTDATSAKFSVSTSSAGGYTLSISADDDTGNLVNGNESLTSISSAISSSTFDNASYNGKWGYKPSKLNSVANTNFQPSPTTEKTILDITESASTNNYTIALGARADFSKSVGEYTKSLVVEAVSNFTPVTCDNTKLCVQYDGNGLTYEHGELVNNVNYNSTTTQQTVTKTLHSDNINDSGIATSNSATNTDQTKIATIDGASSVNVSLYYDTEGASYDWVALYAGADSVPSSTNDVNKGSNGNLTGKLGGNKSGYTTSYTTWNMWNNDGNPIDSDTIKIHFRTDGTAGSYISYGYYAIITGTSPVINRTVASGEYATPTGTNLLFHGWSSTQTTAGGGLPSDVEYTDESEVMSKFPGNEGEAKTLYAVWQQGQTITFTKDSNVSSIAVLDSNGNTVETITNSGQSLTLGQGSTYTLKPTLATGYRTDAITKTSGAGTLNGNEFTVGDGVATINVTSKPWDGKMQTFDCSMLANVGDTISATDSRDNESYLIGKLADGKCWMLDNLRLDVLNVDLNTLKGNTNATDESLTYLKNGGGSSPYATTAVNSTWSGPSGNVYNEPKAIPTYKDTLATTHYGVGSGKIGVYYNYCALSAGSYCYGASDAVGDATQDVCPSSWRLPTAGIGGELPNLYDTYGNATDFDNAFSATISRVFDWGSQSTQKGMWPSSTLRTDSVAYMMSLSIESDYVTKYNYAIREMGFTVRCVLK